LVPSLVIALAIEYLWDFEGAYGFGFAFTESPAENLNMANGDIDFALRSGAQQLTETKLAYSVAEVQKLVGIGRTSIFKAIKNRRLQIAKCGSRTLILSDDLHAWIVSLRRGN
jgi:excisionase family DNA binding protein